MVRLSGVLLVAMLCLAFGAQAAQALPTISVDDTSVVEGTGTNTTANFTVHVNGAVMGDGPVVVNYVTQPGASTAPATSSSDFLPVQAGQVSIPEGQTTAQLPVTVVADASDEYNEDFRIKVTAATAPDAPALPQDLTVTNPLGFATATITDDDAPPTVSVADATTNAPVTNGATRLVVFDIKLSAVSGKPLFVDFATHDGTGPNGAVKCADPARVTPAACSLPGDGDYIAQSGTRYFDPGTLSQQVTVLAIGDSLDIDKTFTLELTNPTHLVAPSALLGTDDEGHAVTIDGQANTIGKYLAQNPASVTLGTARPNGAVPVSLPVSLPRSFSDGVVSSSTTLTSIHATFRAADVGKTISVTYAPNDVQTATIESVNNDHQVTLAAPGLTNGSSLSFGYDASFVDGRLLGGPDVIGLAPGHSTATGSIPSAGPKGNVAAVTVNEGAAGSTTMASIPVTLTAPPEVSSANPAPPQASPQDVSVAYATTDASAKAGTDYTAAPANARLVIPKGQTTGTVQIPVKGNNINEPDKTFSVAFSDPQHLQLAPVSIVVTIKNDDPTPGLSAPDVTVAEPSGTTSNAVVNVSLAAASARTLTATYSTQDGTAIAGTNYGKTTGTLTFNPGETAKQVSIPIAGDGKVLDDLTFALVIQNTADGAPAVTSTVRMTEGDLGASNTPTLNVNDAAVHDRGTASVDATFTVRMDQALGRKVTVDYGTANGTAIAPKDYVPASGTLTFAAGETSHTVTVRVNGAANPTFNKNFLVKLSNPTSAKLGRATGTGIIIDDTDVAFPAKVSPAKLRGRSFLCLRKVSCPGLVVGFTAPEAGKVGVLVTAPTPPVRKGGKPERLVLLKQSWTVKKGKGTRRVKVAAGRNTTTLLTKLRKAKPKKADVAVTFTDRFGAQRVTRFTLPLTPS